MAPNKPQICAREQMSVSDSVRRWQRGWLEYLAFAELLYTRHAGAADERCKRFCPLGLARNRPTAERMNAAVYAIKKVSVKAWGRRQIVASKTDLILQLKPACSVTTVRRLLFLCVVLEANSLWPWSWHLWPWRLRTRPCSLSWELHWLLFFWHHPETRAR